MEQQQQQHQQLSADEAALYDRGIRLWGVNAQQKLRESRVLVLGFSVCGAEVCKNLVLAGINSLTIVDNSPKTADPNEWINIFSYPEDGDSSEIADAHKNAVLSDSALEHIREMNKFVSVSACRVDPCTDTTVISEHFFSTFHFVCACSLPLAVCARLDEQCRKASVPFLCVNPLGSCAFMYTDIPFLDMERLGSLASSLSPPAKKQKDSTALPFRRHISLADAMSLPWDRFKELRCSPLMYIVSLIYGRETKGMTGKGLISFANEFPQNYKREYIKEELVKTLEGQQCKEFAPVCAIIGGIAAQEVLKELMHDYHADADAKLHESDPKHVVTESYAGGRKIHVKATNATANTQQNKRPLNNTLCFDSVNVSSVTTLLS